MVAVSIPSDMSPTPDELRAEVARLVHPFVHSARSECGRIPGVGSAQWWAASTAARIAGLLVLAEAWLTFDPERAIDERFKAAAVDLCRANDWTAEARRPLHSELAARRAILVTPVRCQYQGCGVVLSMEHPLPPDLRTVRCKAHGTQSGVAA